VLPLTAPPYELSHSAVGLFGLAGAMGAMGAAASGRLADRGLAETATGLALFLMLIAWVPIALLPWTMGALVVGAILIDFALQSAHVANQSMLHETSADVRSRLTAAICCFNQPAAPWAPQLRRRSTSEAAGWASVRLAPG
jgi:predicted MFS family arabinose efflux permease